MIYLDDDEARIFLMLRQIAMRGGSVRINYDDQGTAQSIDTYKHYDLNELSSYPLDKRQEEE